jgi:hypothetical protein
MKKMLVLLAGLGSLCVVSVASAANTRDVAVSIEGPETVYIGSRERYQFKVTNLGNRAARDVVMVIDLPQDGAPFSYPVNRCAPNGPLQLVCDMGSVGAGVTKTVNLRYDFAVATGAAPFAAEVSTSDNDIDMNNDQAARLVIVTEAPPIDIAQDDQLYGASCFDSVTLTWGDCVNNPSAVFFGLLRFNSDGSVVPDDPSAYGFWSQSSGYDLTMTFYLVEDNSLLSVFHGEVVSGGGDCFEGTIETFVIREFGAWKGCMSGFPPEVAAWAPPL